MSFLTRFERLDPFEELSTLRHRMDHLMTRLGSEGDEPLFQGKWAPTADVIESKDAIIIKAELPGVTEKDISVEVENGVLTLKGERNFEKETEEKGYRRIEREYGNFVRSFTLPANVNSEKITASYTNGLLELQIPKKEEAKPRAIKVDVNKKLSAAA
jgi:HSP20 family protein